MATGYEIRRVELLAAVEGTPSTLHKGPWRMVGKLLSPTLVVTGMEADAVCQLRVSNAAATDANGVYTPPADDDIGAPHLTLGNITADIAAGLGGSFTFVRVLKTPGVTPTATTATLTAQQAK